MTTKFTERVGEIQIVAFEKREADDEPTYPTQYVQGTVLALVTLNDDQLNKVNSPDGIAANAVKNLIRWQSDSILRVQDCVVEDPQTLKVSKLKFYVWIEYFGCDLDADWAEIERARRDAQTPDDILFGFPPRSA